MFPKRLVLLMDCLPVVIFLGLVKTFVAQLEHDQPTLLPQSICNLLQFYPSLAITATADRCLMPLI